MRSASLIVVTLAILLTGCHDNQKPATTTTTAATADTEKAMTDGPHAASKPAMVFGLGPGFELAPSATYTAKQQGGQVTITATGENPTPGYEVKLVQSPLRIWPPQWMLAQKRPEGIVLQVITPFEVSASFKSDDPVKAVIVGDAAERHEVQVEQ